MEDFLRKIKDSLDKGEISDEILKIKEISERSETMKPKLKKEENNIKDVELIDSGDFKRNKEFSKFIEFYNKTLTLFYSINIEKLSKDEIELYNNFKNKFV